MPVIPITRAGRVLKINFRFGEEESAAPISRMSQWRVAILVAIWRLLVLLLVLSVVVATFDCCLDLLHLLSLSVELCLAQFRLPLE